MDHPYTFDKVYACQREELLGEAQQWELFKAWRAAPAHMARRASLVAHALQVRWSDGSPRPGPVE